MESEVRTVWPANWRLGDLTDAILAGERFDLSGQGYDQWLLDLVRELQLCAAG